MDPIENVLSRVSLRPVELNDAALIFDLRSSSRAAGTLSAGAQSVSEQHAWLLKYFQRAAEGIEYYFIIMDGSSAVGAVRIYDVDPTQKSFTWGSWIIREGTDPIVAGLSVVIAYDFAFDKLSLNRAFFDVVAQNLNVIRFHRNFGARVTSESDVKIAFALDKSDYGPLRARFLNRMRGLIK